MISLFLMIVKLSVKASIALITVLILQKLLHNFLSPKAKYFMWVILLIILSLPFTIESELSIYNLPAFFQSQKSIELNKEKVTDASLTPIITTNETNNTKPSINYEILDEKEIIESPNKKSFLTLELLLKVSSIIWIIGSLSFITIYIIQLKRLKDIINSKKELNNKSLSNILNQSKKKLNISRNIKLYETSELSSPALTGIFNIKILLPDYLLDNLSDNDLKFIIYHELCHLKRLDNITNYIILIYKSVYWFNPLIHIMFKCMKRDMEISCDNLVLNYIAKEDYSNYGMTIINTVEKMSFKKQSSIATCLIEDKSEIVRRIKMIKKHNKFSKTASVLTLSVVLLVGCSTVSEPVKDTSLLGSKVEEKNNESIEKGNNDNVENKKDNTTENSNQDKSTELTPNEAFEIASKTVKDYFNFDTEKSSFDPNNIIDMGNYWIITVSNSNGSFQVRISLDDKQSFMIAGSASAANKLEEELKKAKNIDKDDKKDYSEYIKEYYDYLYSKEPISKEESKKIAEELIKSSPLKDMNLNFLESESFYELKFDSPEKEFYVFAYLKDDQDSENPQNLVFIKVNTYLKEVSEVTF